MASSELNKKLSELHVTADPKSNRKSNSLESQAVDDVQITWFTENLHDTVVYFQIIRLAKQGTYQFLRLIAISKIGICRCLVFGFSLGWTSTVKCLFVYKCNCDAPCASKGCNSAKFGHLYAAAPTRPNNVVGVTPLLGGSSDNTGSSVARHVVLKTGLNLILACNIPKDSPMLEAAAERKLLEKLKSLGYAKAKHEALSSISTGPR